MKNFNVFYDEKEDILYLAKEGQEAEVVELAPGINAELNSSGDLIGVEIEPQRDPPPVVIRQLEISMLLLGCEGLHDP